MAIPRRRRSPPCATRGADRASHRPGRHRAAHRGRRPDGGLRWRRMSRSDRRAGVAPTLDSPHMPEFKPAYLIHGDDHGRISERRARCGRWPSASRARTAWSASRATTRRPTSSRRARRDDVRDRAAVSHRRRRRALEGRRHARHLLPALENIGPETTIAFFAREEGASRSAPQLAKTVEQIGGNVAAERDAEGQGAAEVAEAEPRRLGVALDASRAGARRPRRRSPAAAAARAREAALSSGRSADRRRGRRRGGGTLGRAPGLGPRRPARRGRPRRDDPRLPRARRAGRVARAARPAARPPGARGPRDRPAAGGGEGPADQGRDQRQLVGARSADRRGAPLRRGPPQPRARGAGRPRAGLARGQRAERSHRGDPGHSGIAA